MTHNVDTAELDKFSQLAHKWWDPESEFKPLHQINPLRLQFIQRHLTLSGARVIDVGCGGGILAESLAKAGASVCAIDLSKRALQIAQLHALESDVTVDYRCLSVEEMADEASGQFAGVMCMELLEHVPDPASMVTHCAQLLKPGGWAFFSTLNRNARAYLEAIIGAEYLLRLLPRGTHDYARFIKPSELGQKARAVGLLPKSLEGIRYNPLTHRYSLSPCTDVNYLIACQKPC